MPENVESWWARRQSSKGVTVPYAVGRYREDWERYPALIRQFHPELNAGITLTQIPPAADVWLLWECSEMGHQFIATPDEQRHRPGMERRRSVWCPHCSETAVKRRVRQPTVTLGLYDCGHERDADRVDGAGEIRCYLCRRFDSSPVTRGELLELVTPSSRGALNAETRTAANYRWVCPVGHGSYAASIEKILGGRRCSTCRHAAAAANRYAVGEAFVSPWAPKTASALEGDLRHRIANRYAFDMSPNAIRVARAFYSHLEVWPDVVIAELKVAIELDTVGRHGLEHVGRHEARDRRKDRLIRAAGWEVIRIRMGKLREIGPFDIRATGISQPLMDHLDERLAEICGRLFVMAYAA